MALVEHVPSQRAFAMKRMSRAFIQKYRHQETARREREISGAVDSPFLSKMLASFSGEKNLYTLLEWCEGGELLLQLERQEKGHFSPERVAFYVAGVAVGLMYLHDRGIVFRGVKPENVMLAQDGYPVGRLTAGHPPYCTPHPQSRIHVTITPTCLGYKAVVVLVITCCSITWN